MRNSRKIPLAVIAFCRPFAAVSGLPGLCSQPPRDHNDLASQGVVTFGRPPVLSSRLLRCLACASLSMTRRLLLFQRPAR
jgi:hypothetical protein